MKKFLILACFLYLPLPASADWYPYNAPPQAAIPRNAPIITSPYSMNGTYVYPNGTHYVPGFGPVYGVPTPINGGFYGIGGNGVQYNFWKSSSGYYYPWGFNPYAYTPPIIIYQQGAAVPSEPPLSTVFRDMQNFLDESKTSGKLEPGDFEHLNLRLQDLRGKADEERTDGGGTLDSGQETDLRQNLNQLGDELSHRIKH